MADVTEVGQALVEAIAAAAYPHGTAEPSTAGCPIVIYQGWPNAQRLAEALPAGTVHVSVFPRPGDKVTSVMSGDGEWCEQDNDGTSGLSVREVRRQSRTFQITIWASCFERRDPVAKAIDSALSSVTRLALPDGSQGVMTYVNSTQDDDQQKQGIYRRDLFYSINYATTQAQRSFVIREVDLSLQRAADASDAASPVLGHKLAIEITATSVRTTIIP